MDTVFRWGEGYNSPKMEYADECGRWGERYSPGMGAGVKGEGTGHCPGDGEVGDRAPSGK